MIINVLSYLEYGAKTWPGRAALADAETSYTYAEEWAAVRSFGEALYARIGRVGGGRPVVVCTDHTASDVIAFFGAVYSGNFYLPVDLSLPEGRVADMINAARPAAIIIKAGQVLPAAVADAGYAVYDREELRSDAVTEPAPWKTAKDTDLLYVLFTSGSTGVPKGVCISHRSVIDMTEQFASVFGFCDGEVFGNQAPFDFDVSVKDIFLALKVGGRLEILEKKLFSLPKLLVERMNERRVTAAIWAVPALRILAALKAFKTSRPETLRYVMFSGEVIPPKTLDYWRSSLPGAVFVNLYGPTEITCNCTYHILDTARDYSDGVPVGGAFPNCSVFLLDGEEEVTEEGRVAEICVSGTCLSPGYLGRPDLTAAAFIRRPGNGYYAEPTYRTGDLGCLRGGELYYAGRADTQIKHMGHRIELAEIESRAALLADVDAAACVYDADAAVITLFYTGGAEPDALLSALRERLPRYMMPRSAAPLCEFPRTRTGKIDRKELLKMTKGE